MSDKVNITSPRLEGEDISFNAFGKTEAFTDYGVPEEPAASLTAFGGEVNVLFDPLVAISAGKLTQRADGKVTLNLTKQRQTQALVGTLAGGATVPVVVSQSQQNRGVVDPTYYYLPEVDGACVVEKGNRHITVHISESSAAYSRQRIALEKGITETAVTGAYLLANPEYGTQQKPLTAAAFDTLFTARNGLLKQANSDWYLFERGHEYAWGNMIEGVKGEGKLTPLRFATWGTGARPKIGGLNTTKDGWKNVVFHGIDFTFLYVRYCQSLLIEDCMLSKRPGSGIHHHQIDASAYTTYKGNRIIGVRAFHSKYGTYPTVPYWKSRDDRAAGIYGADGRNTCMYRNFIDKNAWEYGYDPTSPASNELPQPPDSLSHNLYFSFGMYNLCLLENIISRSPGNTSQIRAGGILEGNCFFENNFGISVSNGNGAKNGANFSDYYDNVHIGALHMQDPWNMCRIAAGPDIFGFRAGVKNSVVAHSADPNDPADRAAKPSYDRAENSAARWKSNDTIVYKWNSTDKNTAGLDTVLANNTTFQKYATAFLGLPAGVKMRDALDRMWLDDINIQQVLPHVNEWMLTGFGIGRPDRSAATTVRFAANPEVNGFWGKTRFNWTTEDLPGAVHADTVDLDGHYVHDGLRTANYAALSFGGGGEYEWSSGKLTVGNIADEGFLHVRYCGQVFVAAASAPMNVHAEGGRLSFTGPIGGLNLLVDGDAQALLGPNATVPAGRKLTVAGQRCKAGWHGAGANVLNVFGTLEFVAGLQLGVNNTIYKHKYLETGADIDGNGWSGKIADYEAMNHSSSGANHLWVTHMTGTPVPGEVFFANHLIEEDGSDDRASVTMKNVISAGCAGLTMFRSGQAGAGEVAPTGTGEVRLKAGSTFAHLGFPAGTYEFGGAGTGITYINEGATLPAGVSVTGGKLVLVV